MGEHKSNPTALAAKKGELPPKPKKMSKRQCDAWLTAKIEEITGINRLRDELIYGRKDNK